MGHTLKGRLFQAVSSRPDAAEGLGTWERGGHLYSSSGEHPEGNGLLGLRVT